MSGMGVKTLIVPVQGRVLGKPHTGPRISGRRPTQHEDDSYHRSAEADARAEKLNDIHGTIRREGRALHNTVKSCKANQQWNNPDHDRWPFAINHSPPSAKSARCRHMIRALLIVQRNLLFGGVV
jgi:hypothetical protein